MAVLRSLVDGYIVGCASGGAIGAAGNVVLECVVKANPAVGNAAMEGLMIGAVNGAIAGSLGDGLESAVDTFNLR